MTHKIEISVISDNEMIITFDDCDEHLVYLADNELDYYTNGGAFMKHDKEFLSQIVDFVNGQ